MRKNTIQSPRYQKIYEFIVAFKQANNGNSPTVREILDACGISSTSMVDRDLDRMAAYGMIERTGKYRMISIPGSRWLPPAHLKVDVTPQEPEYQDAEKLLLVVSRKQPIHTS